MAVSRSDLPHIKVLVHKSLIEDGDAVRAISDYLWWGEFPEGYTAVKCTRRRDDPSCDCMYIFDPADGRRTRRGAANGYIITNLLDW